MAPLMFCIIPGFLTMTARSVMAKRLSICRKMSRTIDFFSRISWSMIQSRPQATGQLTKCHNPMQQVAVRTCSKEKQHLNCFEWMGLPILFELIIFSCFCFSFATKFWISESHLRLNYFVLKLSAFTFVVYDEHCWAVFDRIAAVRWLTMRKFLFVFLKFLRGWKDYWGDGKEKYRGDTIWI